MPDFIPDAELDAMETWAETDVLRLIGAYREAREVVRELLEHAAFANDDTFKRDSRLLGDEE